MVQKEDVKYYVLLNNTKFQNLAYHHQVLSLYAPPTIRADASYPSDKDGVIESVIRSPLTTGSMGSIIDTPGKSMIKLA